MKELNQHYAMDTYVPVDRDSLIPQQKSDAMRSLMFLTEKRDGRTKARACADGSSQRRRTGYKKEDSASSTVATDSVFITGVIEAHDRRKVVCYDIPGAFLHADCEDEDTFMQFRGKLVELLVLVEPKLYREHVKRDSRGEAVLYVCMHKALHGMLKWAYWFYMHLRERLKDFGFEVNPCDPYVVNKMVNGRQMMVKWHLGNLKVSHIDGQR